MLTSLYSRLALALTVVLVLVGTVFGAATWYLGKRHTDLAVQAFNRDLALNLINERQLVSTGQLNKPILKKVFSEYMNINPNIEIYLLDTKGEIVSFSAPLESVKLDRVSLEPIHTFLKNSKYQPVVGDDPRNPGRKKPFSVAPINTAQGMYGYLYVVLRGNDYEAVEEALEQRYLLRIGLQVLTMSLLVGLIAGLLVLWRVTRPLAKITRSINQLQQKSDFLSESHAPVSSNELQYLERSYSQLVQRIEEQFSQLEQIDAERRDLIANISHDLRTPLASVVGYLEVLKTKTGAITAEQQSAYVDIAFKNAQRLSGLIDDLFELARLEAGGLNLKLELFSIAELADIVVSQQQPSAEKKSILLLNQSDPVLPLASGDINLVQRVLENLVANAIQHNAVGSQVRLEISQTAESIRIAVADDGEHIAEAQFRQLLGRFNRGAERDESRVGCGLAGAGLGLSIARQIVLLHGSDIRIENYASGGKAIYFSLAIPKAVERIDAAVPKAIDRAA